MKTLNVCYLILLSSLMAACMEQAPSELVFSNTRTPSGVTASAQSVNKKLWSLHCASCHTNISNGFPTKLYATESDIRGAITAVDTMKHLSGLTKAEVKYISDYLNIESVNDILKVKNINKVDSKPVIGTRSFVLSKMKSIYTTTANVASDTSIYNLIKLVDSYAGSFGGTCIANYETCTGEETENYNAPMNMSSNIMRSGAMIRVCREVHNNTTAVQNALDYCEILSTSDSTNANIQKAIDAYLPGYDDVQGKLMNELKTVYTNALSSGMTSKNAWSMVLYTLCSSAINEKL